MKSNIIVYGPTTRRWPMPRFSVLLCLVLTLAFSSLSMAQDAQWDVDHLEKLIPQNETQLEIDRFEATKDGTSQPEFRDNPPMGPIRNCAEWEPTTGVMIRYPLGLPYNLLRDLDDQVTLHVVVSSSYQASAQSNLSANGVDMNKVEFLVRNNNSIWTRDYGPWFIFDGFGQIGIVDHTYNRSYRPDDNLIPYYFGLQQSIPVYSHSMYHTGGNYMTDGAHISSSTRLVYDEASSYQGMTNAEVDALMGQYYGVENYTVLEYIESGGIHHIDTLAKFLDEETVLVKEVWPSHHTYNTLEQRATLLASLTSSTGRPYDVHRIYCYPYSGTSPASYTNSIILNDHIYVPTFGNTTYDEAALQVYRDAMPGYEVSGYYYSGFISDDALHCRTKGIMDTGMLRVGHIPVWQDQEGAVAIVADIVAHSGQSLTQAVVNYRHDAGPWLAVDLELTSGHSYQGMIPSPDELVQCEYYISVTDASGRSEGMPRSQPSATYTFAQNADISEANDAPELPVASLHGNYPNPFNPTTTFSFSLKYEGEAELTVVDARGRLVKTLASGIQSAGDHEILWDGKDSQGRELASGAYFYRLRAAGLQYTKTATLIK
jgi:agmatine deiminase